MSNLKQDIDRYFDVFKSNVEDDLHQLLKPSPAAVVFQSKFEKELDEFHSAVMNRLRQIGLI